MSIEEKLRIGDYVKLSLLDGSLTKEVSLNKEQLIGILKGQYIVTPIPLTEKWIEDLGGYKISECNYAVELYRMGKSFYAIKITFHANCWKWWLETHFQVSVNYVHELQSLLLDLKKK